ncbi:MAG: NADH-quinone oxidoreductase subunit NuoE family protein [Deltaproteobacteria bacterium]
MLDPTNAPRPPSRPLTDEEKARFDREIGELCGRFPGDRKRAAMLPALHLMQGMLGYLTPEALEIVAARLELPATATAEVATFYSMFRLEPAGRYVLDVCTNIGCGLCGAEQILAHLETRLGISVGETTPDSKFTLREVECLASCGTGPVLQINDEFQERLTPEKVDAMLERLE